VVRIPPGARITVSCKCGVFSRKGLWVGPIPLPEESHRECVTQCDKGPQCASTPTVRKQTERKKERRKEKHQTREVLIVTSTGRDWG